MTKVIVLLIATFASVSYAQTAPPPPAPHSVTLFWNYPSPSTFNIYRAPGACPSIPPTASGVAPFVKINTVPISVTTFQDLNVVSLTQYCYYSSALGSVGTPAITVESVPSNAVTATIPPGPPTVTTVVIQ